MTSQVLLMRTSIYRMKNLGSHIRFHGRVLSKFTGASKSHVINKRMSSSTSSVSKSRIKGIWGIIERYHIKKHILMSTKLQGPLYTELDIQSGPDVKVLTDNVKENKNMNEVCATIMMCGSIVSFGWCFMDSSNFINFVKTYSMYNLPVWLLIYYNLIRAWQSDRFLKSINMVK